MRRGRALSMCAGALALLLAALVPHQPRATTVVLVRLKCPVCSGDFAATRLGSYSFFGVRERDLSDMPFAMFRNISTCPHCLYAALDDHFETGTPALLPVLERLPEKLDGALVKACAGEDYFLQILIADACAAASAAPLKERTALQLERYFAAKRTKDAALLAAERERTLERLREALEAGVYTGAEAALFTYLRGELFRRGGKDVLALELFERARAMIAKLGPPAAGADDPAWIATWAEEQTLRIHFAKKSVAELEACLAKPGSACNVAVVVLSERNDAAAWSALRRYVAGQGERLIELDDFAKLAREKLQLDPEFWAWGVAQYRAARKAENSENDSLGLTRFRNRFAHLFDDERNTWRPRPKFAQELAAALRAQTGEAAAGVVFPEGWDERTTLRHLPLAIESGEASATAFFLRWADGLSDERFDDFSYEIETALSAMPGAPARAAALAGVLKSEPDSGSYSRRVLNAALRMLAGDAGAEARLLKLLESDKAESAHWDVAARAFCVAGKPVLKPVLLPLMKGLLQSRVRGAFDETYGHFVSAGDIPLLETFLATIPLRKPEGKEDDPDLEDADRRFNTALHERHDVETMLLRLKLKKLVAECGAK